MLAVIIIIIGIISTIINEKDSCVQIPSPPPLVWLWKII